MHAATDHIKIIIEELADLLNKGNAHMSLDEMLGDIPFDFCGKKVDSLPYTIWQLAEHIRIAQWDILEFSSSPGHISPEWPKEYWPENAAPADEAEWQNCIKNIHADRQKFIELLRRSAEEIFKPFSYGEGQSLLKEALVVADHTAYHAGQIIVLKRLLNLQK